MQDKENVQSHETIDMPDKGPKEASGKQQTRVKTEEDITKDWGIELD